MFSRTEALELMNKWGGESRPFLFILDFEGNNNYLYQLDNIPGNIQHEIGKNNNSNGQHNGKFHFDMSPVDFPTYEKSYQKVISNLNYGNSYLVNLTFPTEVKTDLDLKTIYKHSSSRYKLLVDNEFVVFSPECFIKIADKKIYAYPMKGTIDALIPDARKKIIDNPKETAEHATIVDLIRNDLNSVSENVRVERFRYIEEINTFRGPLLQVSSEIVGDLANDFKQNLGTIIFSLLPAGSISGAPKKKTVQIIKEAEIADRGFFTGVFGVFDGTGVDSAVMIRYIEKQGDKLVFKSGGGITAQSNAKSEYEEMLQKVYVPFI